MTEPATRTMQLIELDYMLQLCDREPRMSLYYLYVEARGVFEICGQQNGPICQMLSESNGHNLKVHNIWHALYELVSSNQEDQSSGPKLSVVEKVVKALYALQDESGTSPEINCLQPGHKAKCLQKIHQLVDREKVYPKDLLLSTDWVCPMLDTHENLVETGTCGYGRLCYGHRKGIFVSDGLPKPERIIYDYLYGWRG